MCCDAPRGSVSNQQLAVNIEEAAGGAVLGALVVPFLKGFVDPEHTGKRLRAFVSENVRAVSLRATQMVEDAGGKVGEVPPKHLIAIAEGASLEDDATLRERWAALLANMAIGSAGPHNFASLLKELTATDALVLDTLAGEDPQLTSISGLAATRHIARQTRSAVMHELLRPPTTLTSWYVDASFDNLSRLGLIRVMTEMHDPRGGAHQQLEPMDFLSLTMLGFQFITAIRPPHRKA